MDTTTRPLIMIINDDSVEAPGIHHLAECVADVADINIFATRNPHTGQSAALTVGAPLRIAELAGRDGLRVFTVNGTPVDCVKLGLHAIVPRRPDLVLSGINHGSNSGTAITYSGTMGAVLDVLEKGLPEGICLNVNIPAKVTPEGIRVCRAAKGHWSEEYKRYLDPSGNPFYWLTGRFVNGEPEADDTDEYWLNRRYISVVPVTPDQSYTPAVKEMSQRFNS